MKRLIDKLLDVYCQYEKVRGTAKEVEEGGCLVFDLADLILKTITPKTVGQVMTLPHATLRMWGLIYLIERDGGDVYDVNDLAYWVIEEHTVEKITPSQAEWDGLKLSEWVDQRYPVNDDDSACTSARPERSEDVRGSNIKSSHGG